MKKFIILMIAVFMVFTMTGCSRGNDGGKESVTAFKLGGSGPLSGGAAIYGQDVFDSAKLAVEEINALDTDVKFELKYLDDAHDAEQAISCFGSLIDWGMQVSLMCVTSKPCAAVAPLYQENSIFAITPSGSSTTVIQIDNKYYGNIFQMCFSDPNQGIASADYIANKSLGSKIAIIYQDDIDYSAGIYEKFAEEAGVKGLNIVYTGSFQTGTNEFGTYLQNAQAAGADVIFLPIYYTEASMILTQANTMGYKPVFFGVDGMDGVLSVEGFDTSLAEGVYLLTPFAADATDEKTVKYVSSFKSKYGRTPNQFGADAYDAVYAIYGALKASGCKPDMSNSDICSALVKQFTSMSFDGLTGAGVTWKATGEVSKTPKAVIIKDGAYASAE
ncbi:MAG: ABC transporter substrate-binding protein [Erysipelotrichaceae bacterium]|nr:ABC transporter substrate-binding protein [Erysipelotrichaceae bacterium]